MEITEAAPASSGWWMPALTAEEDELLMSDRGAFITGSTILMDGGATASYFCGPLKPGT